MFHGFNPVILWDAELHTCVTIIAKMCNKTYQLLDRTLGLDEESLEMRSSCYKTGQAWHPWRNICNASPAVHCLMLPTQFCSSTNNTQCLSCL